MPLSVALDPSLMSPIKAAKAPYRDRRVYARRRRRTRREHDLYRELGKLAGLVASVSAAIVGQAELIGEPWRHVLTVAAVGSTATWAYCMRPNNVLKMLQKMRAK